MGQTCETADAKAAVRVLDAGAVHFSPHCGLKNDHRSAVTCDDGQLPAFPFGSDPSRRIPFVSVYQYKKTFKFMDLVIKKILEEVGRDVLYFSGKSSCTCCQEPTGITRNVAH